MVQFDNKLDAVMHAEALLAGVNMKDSEIAEVSSVLQRETLEQMHIILADPEARAVLRLKLLVKGRPSLINERSQLWVACLQGMSAFVPGLPCAHACHSVAGAALPQKGRHFTALPQKGKKGTTNLQSSRTFRGIPQTLPLLVIFGLITVCVCYRDLTTFSPQMGLLAQEPAHGVTAAL